MTNRSELPPESAVDHNEMITEAVRSLIIENAAQAEAINNLQANLKVSSDLVFKLEARVENLEGLLDMGDSE